MKLFSTLLLLTGSAAIATAQPSLNATTSTPTVGFSMQLFGNNTYAPGTAGANQIWDFSTQSYSSAGSQTYQACNASNNCSTFPGTNLVYNATGSFAYFSTSTAGISFTGIAGGGANIVYSNYQDYFRFPMNYNSSYVDPWAATFVSGGVNFYRSGTDSVTADGWGRLTTPAGIFPSVLRVKRVQTYRDSSNIGGTASIINYKANVYAWYDAAHKEFLYSTSNLVVSPGGASTSFSRYTDNQMLAVERVNGIAQLNISPNPARDIVNISLSLKSASNISMTLADMSGRNLRQGPATVLQAGEHALKLDVKGLPAGVYMLRVTSDDDCVSERVSIAE